LQQAAAREPKSRLVAGGSPTKIERLAGSGRVQLPTEQSFDLTGYGLTTRETDDDLARPD